MRPTKPSVRPNGTNAVDAAQNSASNSTPTAAKPASEGFDPSKRFVKICNVRADGFVEFEFAVGDPALCVELLLPEAAFKDFCQSNEVVMLEAEVADKSAKEDWVSRLNAASRAGMQM